MKGPISVRITEEADQTYLIEWLQQPDVLQWFPLANLREIEDAVRIWMSYREQKAVLTALWDGVPCGSAVLYLHPFRKLAHQSLFAILVDEKYRGKGVGRRLLTELERVAKEERGIELLHLEVYEGNPAVHLYLKMGFTPYGKQRRFIKEPDGRYLDKIMMQKSLR